MEIIQKILGNITSWRKWTKGSINRQIFTATILIGLLTGLSKFASVGKELIVAWRFGTGDELDSFVMAMVVPSFVISVVAGSFSSALIPTYIKVREQQGQKAAQQLFSGIMTRAIGLLIVTAIAIAITAPIYLPLLASGFSSEKLDLTTRLLWSLSPSILLSGIINIWGGVLNAGEKFALAAVSPIITPLTTAAMLLAFPSWGIYALVGGLICGSLIEMIILGIGLLQQGVSVRPQWSKQDANLNLVIKQYFPVIIGAFLMCSTGLVDQSMAAMLSPGSVAALGYANRVIALPLTLVTLALGTAVVPYFSQTIAKRDWRKISHTFNYYLRLIFMTTIPLTIFFILASKLIVQLLFERGSFNAEDTQVVSQIQVFYALQIPFYISAIFVVKLINSLSINHFLAWGSAINLVANIIGNYIFVQWIGVAGIALSTSCVYLISFVFLYILTKKHLQKISLENS
ncbi:virulence factor MviN [Pleurocapsa sp. CCALA 161]|uniref:murein biosynthesis integral membrane protein MurJ n=1 Tax=Pleurocapsa sp. CCALA 161 TaxID=2107688 RepID=UPI000D083990|nr:lipid II flippase MurJ [Pleurocapsa sp. CCALA 161]PSB09471.1 virulence factor MviN [Pleurocapsa sp. CCALA 161]